MYNFSFQVFFSSLFSTKTAYSVSMFSYHIFNSCVQTQKCGLSEVDYGFNII